MEQMSLNEDSKVPLTSCPKSCLMIACLVDFQVWKPGQESYNNENVIRTTWSKNSITYDNYMLFKARR